MNTHTEEIIVSRDMWCDVRLWIVHRDMVGGIVESRVASAIDLVVLTEGVDPVPTVTLRAGQAQHLIDALWREGFRPTEGTGSAGSLAATERHLKDLQRLVFKDFPKDQK